MILRMKDRCQWKTRKGKQCQNHILMDGYCTRHLVQKCSMCWENVKSTNSAQTKRLTCGHSFHFGCILKWFQESDECPVCRVSQKNDPIIKFRNNVEDAIREKYVDAIRSVENDCERLNHLVTRYQYYLTRLDQERNT